ncbi:MAG: T9SS type A sorting domain-containing protein [Bacteroidota bacterium]|nr:T9SS type A sorting domain-containing protein [Bacteroidota bacterium]
MKKIFYILFLFFNANVYSQIITPSLDANFGVDADLRANNWLLGDGDDDWFSQNLLSGIGVIDTTGASSIKAQYAINPAFRYSSFYRGMSVPPFSVVNDKLLLGAAFIRDYHGNDSTSFSGSKNGDSPGNWYSPPTQPVPNKNDILDVMMHVRRDGPSMSDSLWLFGGVSIDGTTGDRYFDFEMYQTDLSFNKTLGTFSGYGPDAGHTAWTFDASGKVTSPGDIIFSADYGSSTLTSIEARIWIDKASMLITPTNFNWSGTFDGASNGAQYGYAGITPKTSGNFYTGLENPINTWAGAFSLIVGNNSVQTNYTPGQFMEFSVNLTKLGLDPNTMVGKSSCDMPFRRFMVKSRSSMSFTSQLKDFVAPVDFFQSAAGNATSDGSLYCGITGPVTLYVSNAVSSSTYTWTTTDGHIVSDPVNDSVTVDSAGTYVVSQQLQSFCPTYSTDTVVVAPFDPSCNVLKTTITDFFGTIVNDNNMLNWSVTNNNEIRFFEVERSADGINFFPLQTINSVASDFPSVNYKFTDDDVPKESNAAYYRLKIINVANQVSYSKIIRLSINGSLNGRVKIFPNPVTDNLQVCIYAPYRQNVELFIYDGSGRLMRSTYSTIDKGNTKLNISDFKSWPIGIYSVKVVAGNDLFINKMILKR